MSINNSTFKRRLRSLQRLDKRNSIASYVEEAERLARDYPEYARAWLECGVAFTEIARYKDARTAFDKSARLCKPEMRYLPYCWKGLLFKEQGKLHMAENCFRHSLKKNPKYADTWGFLGAVLAKQGKFKEAKAAWRKLIRLGTGATEEGHLNLGLIFRAEKRYKEALKHAEIAISLDRNYKDAKRLRKDLLEVLNHGI